MAELRNIKFDLSEDGTILKLEVDLRKNLGPSKSGKSQLVASSGGAFSISGTGMLFNLVVYSKLEDK